ncbi:MAG TPA: hypothetical protein VF532_05460 [Candidatus Angelobacter sp.]
MKQYGLFTLVVVFCFSVAGCGGSAPPTSSSALVMTAGNWEVDAVSKVNGAKFRFGGSFSQSGSNITGAMVIQGSSCFSDSPVSSFNVTGQVNGNSAHLVAAEGSFQFFTLDLSGAAASLSGTYTFNPAGVNCAADNGTLSAQAVPSLTGAWSGTFTPSPSAGGAPFTANFTLTQSAINNGTFGLAGTMAASGNACVTSGTVSDTTMVGSQVTSSVGFSGGNLSWSGTVAAGSPARITGTYTYGAALNGCASQASGTFTLSKQ